MSKSIDLTKFHPALRAALSGYVFAGATPGAVAAARNAPPPRPAPMSEEEAIEELRAQMVETHARMEAIAAEARNGHRGLTTEEQKQIDDLSAQFDQLDEELKRRERVVAQRERLHAPQPRVSQPAPLPGDDDVAPAAATAPAAPPRRTPGLEVVGPVGATKGNAGFRSIGEFALSVRAAKGGRVDQRLIAAASTYGNEATPADGGYAVPPDFRENIVKQLQSEQSLLSLTDQQFTSSNKMTVPRDISTPWQAAGGILATWEAEANATTPTKPALAPMEVAANKIKALVPMTDELLEDAPSLSRYLPGKVADKFTSKINEAIILGDGTGKPEGLLESGSLVTVDPEESQELGVVYENIVNMWSRLYGPLRGDAVWLINQDLEPALMRMVVPGAAPSFPAYLPPGGLSQSPYGQLMGRPVIPQEFCETSGTKGSIILFSPKSYLTVQKVGGIRQAVSMHLYFDQDITAFKFVMRVGGQSWWSAPATRAKGTNTLTNIVTLDDVGE